MKTPNKNVKRLVVWSVASSLVGSSCSGLYADHDLDRFTIDLNNIINSFPTFIFIKIYNFIAIFIR